MHRIYELIGYIGPHSILKEEVHISAPEVSYVSANTLVHIDGLLSSGRYGNYTFRYNRVDLSTIEERTVTVTNQTDLLSLLPLINIQPIFTYMVGSFNESLRKKGYLLSQDIVNEPIGTLTPGSTTTISLRAASTSYLYTGSLKLKLLKSV